MTTEAKFAPANKKVGTDVAKTGAKPPYPFRTVISLILLAGNILVAGIYFHLINP
ncbi:photosystem I protein PsaX [Mastigocladopsis repens]|uniref:photosystem I protein PsaX n=1 Tax=Mastigocladopsis repens TaxID=221287 RepID=UPI00031F0F89|nr:photosystem I protein PsaX [Mastigocladopsis repens]